MVSKSWEIRISNPTDEDIDWVKTKVEYSSMYIAKEIADGGLIHLQGRIIFERSYRLSALKKLHPSAHWEITKASTDWNYYKKVGAEVIMDDIKKPRQRTDIEQIKKKLKTTNSVGSIVEECSFQTVRLCEKILQYNEPQRPIGPIKVVWYWGPTGTGKTRKVFDLHPQIEVFRPVSYKWWEGYDGHKVVLLDDFRKDFCKFHELLTLLDIYPYRVETKGGSRQIQAETFYITSAFGPADLYDGREDIEQLLRRVTHEWKFTSLGPVLVKGLEPTQLID
jgi:hypothetical protein